MQNGFLGGSENSEASEPSEARLSGEGSEASAIQKISVKLPAEPKTVCLKVSIQNQGSLDQILRGAGLRSLQRGKTRVFRFDQLENGAEYTAGSRDDPINTRHGGNQEAGSSPSLAAPAHSNVEADADADEAEDEDEDADDEGAEKDYVMLCCKQVYRPAMGALVECSHCLNWFHLRPVGSCPGESITKAKAKQRHYVHTCSLCNKDPSRRVVAV
jgi:hypothetical protein